VQGPGDEADDVLVWRVTNFSWDDCAVRAHYATDDELADTHADSSVYKERSTTSLFNEEEDDGGKDDE
jgi:hypothetical protein